MKITSKFYPAASHTRERPPGNEGRSLTRIHHLHPLSTDSQSTRNLAVVFFLMFFIILFFSGISLSENLYPESPPLSYTAPRESGRFL